MMSTLELFGLCYAVIGIIYVKLEDGTFEIDQEGYEKSSSFQLVICLMQQIIHYLRVGLVWPLYAIEDILIFLDNISSSDGEEGEGE